MNLYKFPLKYYYSSLLFCSKRITMKVTVKAGLLQKSTISSVGYDLFSSEDRLLVPGEVVMVGTGLFLKLEDCWGLIQDRSGLAAKFGISRRAGVIDPDYEKEIKVVMAHEGREGYQIKAGDRIAQILFFPKFDIELVCEGGKVENKDTIRVEGFGSSGV